MKKGCRGIDNAQEEESVVAAGGDHGKIGLCLYRPPEPVVWCSARVDWESIERPGERLRGNSHSMCCYHQQSLAEVGGSGGYLNILLRVSVG